MGVFKRIKSIFGGSQGPYEEALKRKAEAVRAKLPEGASTIDIVVAAAALVSPEPEDLETGSPGREEEPKGADAAAAGKGPAPQGPDASSRMLEDLHLGDVEMMEFELLLEDLFGVRFSRSEINTPETLGELAELIDGKKK